MSNQRIQETRAQFSVNEYFAGLLVCFRGGMIQSSIANQPMIEVRAENNKIVLNLFTSKSLDDINGKKKE